MPLGSSQLSGGDRQVHAQAQGQGWPLRVDGAQGGPGEGCLWVRLQCSPCPTCGWKERREAAWRGVSKLRGGVVLTPRDQGPGAGGEVGTGMPRGRRCSDLIVLLTELEINGPLREGTVS